MLRQPQLSYTSCQHPYVEPPRPLSEAHPAAGAAMGIVFEGDGGKTFPTGDGSVARMPRLDPLQTGWSIEVFSRGQQPFEVTATSLQPWLSVTPVSARVTTDARVLATIPEW